MKFDLPQFFTQVQSIEGVSDIHFKVGYPPIVRSQGNLSRIERSENLEILSPDDLTEILGYLLPESRKPKFDEGLDIDASFKQVVGENEFRYRVNFARDQNGPYITMRVIPSTIREISQIGFPSDVWKNIVALNQGMVLVTGVTGSGKSTTLASLVQEINRTRTDHIITLEDPIEYIHKPDKSVISQRELGNSLLSFGAGVRSAMRQDPDIILIGEIRDRDTAETALEAAQTGHLVFSTLHDGSAPEAVRRYVDLFEVKRQPAIRNGLASSLSYVLVQQLIPYTEVSGRTLVMEIMNVRDHTGIQNKIRKEEYHQILSDLQSNRGLGMISMDQHLELLVEEGRLEFDAAVQYAKDPVSFRSKFES